MANIGISLPGDSTGWIEDDPDAVECLEIAADGFFARPSPYLAWLGERLSILVRAPMLSIGTPDPLNREYLSTLARVSAAAHARFIVHPLGFAEAGEIRLNTPVPISLTPASLALVVEHLVQAAETLGTAALVEPITGPLRVPGSMADASFLEQLCEQANCRLLVDVTTLLVAGRTHGFDPHAWVRAIPGHLIAAARIGPRIDEAAWALMEHLVSHSRPEVLLLGGQAHPDGTEAPRRDLDRLRSIQPNAYLRGRSSAPEGAAAPPRPTAPPATASMAHDATPTHAGDAGRVERSADVALFVLDDEGVFFSEERRELSLFNTAATLVWCLLEEGLAIDAITTAYRKTFALAEPEAGRHVGTILQRWFGLGYLTRPASAAGDAVPFTTALAQVLTNRRLRVQFRQSPHDLADALRVARADMEAFTGLDPDGLDDLAAEVERVRFPQRHGVAAGGPDSFDVPIASRPIASRGRIEPAPSEQAAPGPGMRYRLLTTTFSIHTESADVREQVHRSLAHLERPGQTPDVVLEFRPSGSGGWVVFDGDLPVAQCRGTQDVVPAVKLLLREMAVNRHPFLLNVHAGVVSFGDGCVLLPAAAGSGKTTLTAALIRSGATYFSDEVAPLDEGTLAVRPVPLALTVKNGSVEPLRPLYPEIDALTPHVREDYVQVRYLPPPAASLPPDEAAQPVRWIVFPRYAPAAETLLRPLTRPAALRRLLDESFVNVERLDAARVESLVQWMRTVECFELPFSSLDTAVVRLQSLTRGRRLLRSHT